MARPKAALVVTEEQRQTLDSMAHRARTAPQLARRARVVLACATGLDNTTVAKKLRMSQPTVGRWRQRFIDKGVDGLLDEPRPGTPRKIGDTQVETIVTRTLESAPHGATHWVECDRPSWSASQTPRATATRRPPSTPFRRD